VKFDRLVMADLDNVGRGDLPRVGRVANSSVSSAHKNATRDASTDLAVGMRACTVSAHTTSTPSSRTNAAYWFFLALPMCSMVSRTWTSVL
jgi:hypothetical protein